MKRAISFKATRSRVLDELPKRSGQWTTSGYWFIRTIDEPRWMQELKTTEHMGELDLDKMAKKFTAKLKNAHLLYPINEYTLLGNVFAQKFSSREGAINCWLNVYFVHLFRPFTKFFGNGDLEPVIVCQNEDKKQVLGVVMPIRRSA